MFTTNRSGCRMCTEPFQHKILILSNQQIDSILTLSKYEIEIIPLLWERILKINAYFCEHVAHSWSLKRQRKDDEIYRLITELTEEEYSMIRNESQRLEILLSETIAEIRNNGKLNQKSEIFYEYTRSFDMKNQTKWRLSIRGRRQMNWNLMAEALIEEFCALSQSDDVHTKQLCILIWKHFIHAVSHCVCQ